MFRARRCAIALAMVFVVAAGCGNDGDDSDNPMDPGPSEPARRTPSELLSVYFKQAYSQQDSTLYPRMLDEAFTFQFLPEDADSLRDVIGEDDSWDKTLDVASTKAMFRSPDVTGVTLNIFVSSNQPDTSCVGCRRMETTVTLRVDTVGDGTEPLTLGVDSPQTFIVKPDATDSTKWVLLRQIDGQRSLPKTGGEELPPSTDSKSWGNIKGLFRASDGAAAHSDDARATEESSWGRIKSLFSA